MTTTSKKTSEKKQPPSFESLWQSKFNELCYSVFYKTDAGKQLLNHLELKYFRSPVAYPNQEPSWAFFNEGKNELIRSFTTAIQMHMQESAKSDKQKETKRKV